MNQTCDTMPEEEWANRFGNKCYFYPERDCPGWKPGTPCGRIGNQIPKDADDSDNV